jgi:dsRNA-specific ribonuclease
MPEYNITKHGLDHCPQFGASVVVNGFSFATNPDFKSSKEAQNTVAKLAFEHLLQAPGTSTDNNSKGKIPEVVKEASQTAGTSSAVKNDRIKELQQLYKNHLQVYAQKKNLALPEYASEREGPSHNCRFKGKVTVQGRTYETTEFFTTLKEAENAAAKVAVSSLLPNGVNEDNSGFYKNLLQELAQKGGYLLPTYCTEKSGNFHPPSFISNVEVGGKVFPGKEASTKKQAEMNAAKVAYMTLTEGESSNSAPSALLEQQPAITYCSTLENLRSFPQPNFESATPVIPTPIVKQEESVVAPEIFTPIKKQKGPAVEVRGNMNISNHVSPVLSLGNNSNVHSTCNGGGEANLRLNPPTETNQQYRSRVLVRPRLLNLSFPPNAIVHYSGDGKWVSICIEEPKDEDIAIMYDGLN